MVDLYKNCKFALVTKLAMNLYGEFFKLQALYKLFQFFYTTLPNRVRNVVFVCDI